MLWNSLSGHAYYSANHLTAPPMRINDKGFWLLVVVAACLLLASWLPAHFKQLFVDETGHVEHGYTLPAVLILLLFRRWRGARILAMFFSALHFFFIGIILWWSWMMNEHLTSAPYVGYGLVALLHLVVFKVLNDSTSVRAFLQKPPTQSLQQAG